MNAKNITFRAVSTALAAAAMACALPLQAQTVVFSDSFSTVTSPNTLVPTPDGANLINAQWQTADDGSKKMRTRGVSNPQVLVTYNSAAFISLEKVVKESTIMTLSADLKMQAQSWSTGGISGDSHTTGRGIGLGFFSTAPQSGTETRQNFTGFALGSNGTLSLISIPSGTIDNSTVIKHATATWQGGSAFSATTAYTLTYSIDTATGGVSSVTLGGVDLTSFFSSVSGVFTASQLSYAGFYASSGSSVDNAGEVDNFSLSGTVVPEPATWALIFGAAALFLVLPFRRLQVRASC